MTPEQSIGRRVKALREAQGLTQEELGTALGAWLKQPLSRQTVSLAEKGRRAFAAVDLLAIAHVLKIQVGALLTPVSAAEEIEMPSGATLPRAAVMQPASDTSLATLDAIGRVITSQERSLRNAEKMLHELGDAYELLALGDPSAVTRPAA